MRARLRTALLLFGPLLLLPLRLVEREGPFNFRTQLQPSPEKEKSVARELFSGTGAERSPFGNGR